MLVRWLGNAFDKARAAVRFATIVQRRMSLANEASGPGRIPDEFMRDAYARAITGIAPTNGRFARREAGPALELPAGHRTNHARSLYPSS